LDPFSDYGWYLWEHREDDNPTDWTKGWNHRYLTRQSGHTGKNSATTDASMTVNENSGCHMRSRARWYRPTLVSPEEQYITLTKDTQSLIGKAADGTKKHLAVSCCPVR